MKTLEFKVREYLLLLRFPVTKIAVLGSIRKHIPLVLLLLIMCVGYLSSYLKFARPRGFKGDFYAAMYDPTWWDGEGIFYGPIFVLERWIVNALPTLATVQIFAFGCVILIAVTLIISIRIVNADKTFTIFCVTVWTFNTFFYYSFSVAANPEIIELVLLITMWWSLSTKRYTLGWVLLTFAVLTKVAPIIFAPLLLLYFTWSGLALSLLTVLGVLAIVSIGQDQSIFLSVSQMVNLNPVEPQPTSEQFLGLSSGLARLFGIQPGQDFQFVSLLALIIMSFLYFLAIYISIKIYKSKSFLTHEIKVAYIFAVFMSLLPIFHFGQTHRHTYLFLAPVFIAFRFIINRDINIQRSRVFKRLINVLFLAYSFLPVYFLDIYNLDNLGGIPFGIDLKTSFVMLTEPIWTNIVLFITILFYGFRVFLFGPERKY